MNTVTITLRINDAEPILRQAAKDAALFGALVDHVGNRTGNRPAYGGRVLSKARDDWQQQFLRAKRLVESFGVEYEPTSEAETLTVDFPYEGGTIKQGAAGFTYRSGATQNFKKPFPTYQREIHTEACRQAASRVVRRWRETLNGVGA